MYYEQLYQEAGFVRPVLITDYTLPNDFQQSGFKIRKRVLRNLYRSFAVERVINLTISYDYITAWHRTYRSESFIFPVFVAEVQARSPEYFSQTSVYLDCGKTLSQVIEIFNLN